MKTRIMELSEITKVIDPIIGMRRNNWFLVTAKDGTAVNTLTAAWGSLGNFCEMPAATIYIRPQRFTRKFIDASGRFTMTFFDFARCSEALAYLGSHSGVDVPDKIRRAGLTLAELDGQPTFAQGKYVLICRTFFRQQLAEAGFLDAAAAHAAFPDKDFSFLYIAQIEAAYEILP